MSIFIPAQFTYRDNDYNLGAETITLEDSPPAENVAADEAGKHALFEAMLKYIVAPISENSYSSYEDNLRYYLDSELLSKVSKENPEMDFDKALYDTHINWAWGRINSLTMREFLNLAQDKVGTKNSSSAKIIWDIKNGMEKEGLDEPIINILDREGGIGSLGQDKIMSYQIKGDTASRLWRAANEVSDVKHGLSGRKQYADILDKIERDPEEYIKITDELGTTKLKKEIKTITIEVDFVKAFDEVIEEQGINPIKERIQGAFAKADKTNFRYPKPSKGSGMAGGSTPRE